MIRRSFITTVLVALGLTKVVEEKVCVIERWERQPDGSYSYNLECGPDGTVRKIDNDLPAGLRTMPYKFSPPPKVVHFRVGLDGIARPVS
jgi:hypothetical protein